MIRLGRNIICLELGKGINQGKEESLVTVYSHHTEAEGRTTVLHVAEGTGEAAFLTRVRVTFLPSLWLLLCKLMCTQVKQPQHNCLLAIVTIRHIPISKISNMKIKYTLDSMEYRFWDSVKNTTVINYPGLSWKQGWRWCCILLIKQSILPINLQNCMISSAIIIVRHSLSVNRVKKAFCVK